ncbi:hypothetical protein QBC46DRAFT_170181 [Diplogelasinospora grovesii]|uniref:Uncharacterized protein n=1 Tax=Diplogelasinospora grovesii TaxID=303347 RepID=A0AAN6S2X9_9PEZI|nr:hypothetical protein QBC46DRAFT_170181 [Diplogelasinospora grovesii]
MRKEKGGRTLSGMGKIALSITWMVYSTYFLTSIIHWYPPSSLPLSGDVLCCCAFCLIFLSYTVWSGSLSIYHFLGLCLVTYPSLFTVRVSKNGKKKEKRSERLATILKTKNRIVTTAEVESSRVKKTRDGCWNYLYT